MFVALLIYNVKGVCIVILGTCNTIRDHCLAMCIVLEILNWKVKLSMLVFML